MPTIRNKLNQRLIINLKSGKNIDLLSKGTAIVSEDDLKSSQLQNLMAKEKVIISSTGEKPKRIIRPKPREKIEQKVSGTEDTSESVVEESMEKSEEKPQDQVESASEDVTEKPEPKKGYKRKFK